MRYEVIDDIPTVQASWADLAGRSGRIFATPEWSEVWWRHFGGSEEPLLLVAREGERIAAVAPMAVARFFGAKVMRFAGHGPADIMGPACAPEDLEVALRGLADRRDAAFFLAERIPAAAERPSGLVELGEEACPVVSLTEGWDAYLKSRSSNFRSQIGRKERKLQREDGLTYRLADATSLDRDIGSLITLHDARWGEEGSGALAGTKGAFHRDFARVALDRGWLRLWLAEVEDAGVVAAWYGFRFGGEEWYYQSGRDPDWDSKSVGMVLLAHTIRSAAEDGVTSYRMLRGGESYKDRFATGDEPVITGAWARGAVLRTGLRAARRGADFGPTRRLMGRAAG